MPSPCALAFCSSQTHALRCSLDRTPLQLAIERNSSDVAAYLSSVAAAAAAARIAGKPDIIEAAKSGDAALVQDHVIADAASVNTRDGRYDCA